MLYLNQELAYHEKLKHEDKWEKAICVNRVNYRRNQMGQPLIKLTTAADNRPVSKPRINYWLEKARQHEWIAAGYDGIAKMIEEGGRNRDGDIARAKMDAYSFRERAKEYKFRAGHHAYPQYTVEV